MKTPIPQFLILVVIVCLGLLQNTQAVTPPPDGGYAHFTTAEGDHALFSLTSGFANTAVGWYSLFDATTGSYNTSVGTGTLVVNNGNENTATGTGALLLNTTGMNNTASGAFALVYNSTGNDNTAVGDRALESNTASGNTAVGRAAMGGNTTGGDNTAIGWFALASNTIPSDNTAVGSQALQSNTTGFGNTAVGNAALVNHTINDGNTAIGYLALQNDTSSEFNTAVGLKALGSATAGGSNVAVGYFAGNNQTTGSGNVYVGAGMAGTAGENNACYIASIFGQTSANGIPVLINASNKLGTATSSARFKRDVRDMDKASEALFALRPVAFRYKQEIDPTGTSQFGLVAEDVEKVNPDLIVRDQEGKPYSVRYDQVNAMLLNEFLKEHRKVEQLEASLVRQEKNFAARLKEQDAKIQQVSDKIELSKAAPRTAKNDQ